MMQNLKTLTSYYFTLKIVKIKDKNILKKSFSNTSSIVSYIIHADSMPGHASTQLWPKSSMGSYFETDMNGQGNSTSNLADFVPPTWLVIGLNWPEGTNMQMQ